MDARHKTMRIRRTPLLLATMILFVVLCALPFIVHAANPPARVRITSLLDGTYLISDDDLGYQLTIPAGWYPIALPSSQAEIDKFNTLTQEHDLPFEKDWLPSLPPEALRFAVIDLEKKNYEDNAGALIAAPYTYATSLVPDGAIASILNLMKMSDNVTATSTEEISGQEVGIVEFATPPGNEYSFGGKVLAFIRKGTVISVVGVSSKRELVPGTVAIIDQIAASLTFLQASGAEHP